MNNVRNNFDVENLPATFCVLPWVSFLIGGSSKAGICTAAEESLTSKYGKTISTNELTLEEIWNGPEFLEIRSKMLAGEKIPYCKNCDYIKSLGGRDHREISNKRWLKSSYRDDIIGRVRASQVSNGEVNLPPLRLEINVGNKCNLKCRMCYAERSSEIYDEQKNLLKKDHKRAMQFFYLRYFSENHDLDWEEDEMLWGGIRKWLPHTKELHFTGGEPILIRKTWSLLDYIKKEGLAKNISLGFEINCTNIPDKLIELSNQFFFVSLSLSVDGYRDVQEYIRYPSLWSEVEENIRRLLLKKTENISVCFLTVVQIYNILDLPNLLCWFDRLNREFKANVGVYLINCRWPEFFKIENIPVKIKLAALDKIERHKENYRSLNSDPYFVDTLEETKKILRNSSRKDNADFLMDKFFQYTQILDEERGNTFSKTFIELNALLKESFHSNKKDISSTFCPAKWYDSTLWLYSGYVASCCYGEIQSVTPEDVMNEPSYLHNTFRNKESRKEMLAGARPSECNYCWTIEDMGKNVSERFYRIYSYGDVKKEVLSCGSEENTKPKALEIGFDRTCNLACSYCSYAFSTKWVQDIAKNGNYRNLISVDSDMYKIVDIKNDILNYKNKENPYMLAFWKWWPEIRGSLRELRLTGGEPTLSKDFWLLLESLVEDPPEQEIYLSVTTNLSVDKTLINKLIDISNRLKNFSIQGSCDATGDHAEYLRDGLCYKTYCNNVEKILSSANMTRFRVMITISALCLFSLEKLLEQILIWKEKYPHQMVMFYTNLVKRPSFMNVLTLPDELLEERQRSLSKWVERNYSKLSPEEYNYLLRIIDYLKCKPMIHSRANPRHLRQLEFKSFFSQYDKRRGKSFHSTFPDSVVKWFDGIPSFNKKLIGNISNIEAKDCTTYRG